MQILVFIILKILEISAVVFIPLGFGKIMKKCFPKFCEVGTVGEVPTYLIGAISLLVLCFVGLYPVY